MKEYPSTEKILIVNSRFCHASRFDCLSSFPVARRDLHSLKIGVGELICSLLAASHCCSELSCANVPPGARLGPFLARRGKRL